MRRTLRIIAVGIASGALLVSSAWAGVGLGPVGERVTSLAEDGLLVTSSDTIDDAVGLATRLAEQPDAGSDAGPDAAASLAPGELLAGAAKISIDPRPDDYGGTWRQEGCATLGEDLGEGTIIELLDPLRTLWPVPEGCIYMGGHGIGPMNPMYSVDDEAGLWVRTVALSDGTETVLLTLIDAVYYFGEYASFCDDCGAFQIAQRLGGELGIDPAGFFIAATHSHSTPDLLGAWGGVPQWYMSQIQDAIEGSIRAAVDDLRPARLEIGEELARGFNNERRNTYRAAEEAGMSWLRVVRTDGLAQRRPETAVIATVVSYAAHPVAISMSLQKGDADWPGRLANRLEQDFGGIAMAMPTGLGNMSRRGNLVGLAEFLPPVGEARTVDNPTIGVRQSIWLHPTTNLPLDVLGLLGLFDRPFELMPAQVSVGKNDLNPCVSFFPLGVRTGVNAARIGPLYITGAPGETFSNISNTFKEANPDGVTMPLAMTNDGLGYIIQSFEFDILANQAVGFIGGEIGREYEEAYAIDRCFGDMVVEETLQLMAELRGG